MQNQFLLHEVASMVGIRGYRIAYAISQRYLPEPAQRLNHQRIFTPDDVTRIRKYFASKSTTGRSSGKEAHE